jgi:hypothetical protein
MRKHNTLPLHILVLGRNVVATRGEENRATSDFGGELLGAHGVVTFDASKEKTQDGSGLQFRTKDVVRAVILELILAKGDTLDA